ncbi:MAG TPA: PH domain-containing protein [Chloroflexia bacterium]|nr:PH domain-containing protein [Chloroflexia bacterium]
MKRAWSHNFEQRAYARAVSSPGLCLYAARFYDMGTVKMCATARQGSILLIKTDKETYGINPADREGFLDALKARTTLQ